MRPFPPEDALCIALRRSVATSRASCKAIKKRFGQFSWRFPVAILRDTRAGAPIVARMLNGNVDGQRTEQFRAEHRAAAFRGLRAN